MVFQDGCAEIFHNSTFWARFGPKKLKIMIFEFFSIFSKFGWPRQAKDETHENRHSYNVSRKVYHIPKIRVSAQILRPLDFFPKI